MMIQENRKIVSRTYYAVKIRLASPLNISGGNDHTDADMIRNGSGDYFVPGTSLAGAFRNYLNIRSDMNLGMGYSRHRDNPDDGDEGAMSSLFIEDLFLENASLSTRDSVALNEDKTVGNKFDMEIIETGAEGVIRMSMVARERDEFKLDDAVATILNGLQFGEIRLGSKKNRGLGKLEVLEVNTSVFGPGEASAWLNFLDHERETDAYQKHETFDEFIKAHPSAAGRFIRISVPLQQRGGLSIRHYSTRPGAPDFEQIRCNGVPVIPGSSWNGAIRSDALRTMKDLCALLDLSTDKAVCFIDQWFGRVRKEDSWQSNIIVSESILKDSRSLQMTRNRINRFDASTKSGALYTEKAEFNGNTVLNLLVRKEEGYQAFLGLLLIVVKDIENGVTPIGGESSIGRGIFALNGNIEWSEPVDEKACAKALYGVLKEEAE